MKTARLVLQQQFQLPKRLVHPAAAFGNRGLLCVRGRSCGCLVTFVTSVVAR
jgi:hypothetical protein